MKEKVELTEVECARVDELVKAKAMSGKRPVTRNK